MSELPVLALLQPAGSTWSREELVFAVAAVAFAAVIGAVVFRFVRRLPWPRPFRLRFALLHLTAAMAASLAWLVLTSAMVSLTTGDAFLRATTYQDRLEQFILMGSVSYAIIAGFSYTVDATARAARAEAAAARTQLAALRAQLEPHFLSNALHTVVQLIPTDPDRAVEAAELVADLLRATLEEDRDMVTLADEWAFVSRYLQLEGLRFGDRLSVRAELEPGLLDVRIPAFALQTLVENAVRHGAAPRVEPTEIVVTAGGTNSELRLSVWNTGDADPQARPGNGAGTGLLRLRQRLAAIHGGAARLVHGPRPDGGFEAVVVLPRPRGDG